MTEIQDIELRLIDEPETALRAEIDDVALDELASDIRDNGLYYPTWRSFRKPPASSSRIFPTKAERAK